MSKSIRIRTTPNGEDKYVKINLEQEFDFIEILSLKISQEDAYRNWDDVEITENVDLEVDKYVGRQIVDIALLNLSDAVNDPTKYQIKLKSILQLDTLYR